MSDEETEENGEHTDNTRTLNVVVKKDNDEADVKTKAQRYDELVDAMAERLNEKHNVDLFYGKNMDEMKELDEALDGKKSEREHVSSGVVSLLRKQSNPSLSDEYESDEIMGAVYQIARDENHPQQKEALESLERWRKGKVSMDDVYQFARKGLVLEQVPKGLEKAGWQEYTAYLQEQTRKKAVKK